MSKILKKIFQYPQNTVVERIEMARGRYDLQKNIYVHELSVIYRDGSIAFWRSDLICGFRGSLLLDAAGTRIFGCSSNDELYCCDLSTGALLWKIEEPTTERIVMNENGTLTAWSYLGFFVTTFDGEITKILRMSPEDRKCYINGGFFLIRYAERNWEIIDSEYLETHYEIPGMMIKEGLQDIRILGNLLYLKYLTDDGDADCYDEFELDLTPYGRGSNQRGRRI